MKITAILSASALAIALSSCGGLGGNQAINSNSQAGASAAQSSASILGGMLQTAAQGNNLQNMLTSVIGLDKVKAADLIGTWRYNQPGCAFTTEQTLAKAGGEAVAANVKERLVSVYKSVGVTSQNTSFTFNNDGTFSASFLGYNIPGNYTFNEKDQSIKIQTVFMNFTAYAKRNADGMAILFESKKILQILQTAGAMSGNQTLNTIAEISQNYDGVRIGFDCKK